jgi:Fe2+ or Zn2+ uptake regulation protein
MAPRRKPARRARPRARAPRVEPLLETPEPLPRVVRVGLLEPPHSHIVCRSCGRISRLELSNEERQLLVALAAQHPAGWSVDGVAFSLTGACARCREGARA